MEKMVLVVAYCAIAILAIASMWKVFQKAGQPGWFAIVPIYNAYILLKVSDKPGWWLLLMFVPGVNIVCSILASISLAERFGRSTGFGVGLTFLGFIFYPVLAFGSARYSPRPPFAKAA
jgi:hypothetical protein